MFKNLLAKVGIGSAKVDTVLEQMTLTQGDTAHGVVHIQGGKIDQDINRLTISIMTTAKGVREVDGEDEEFTTVKAVASMQVEQAMKIEAGEKYEVPFSFKLPSETPITSIATGLNASRVWVYTELDIESGLDSGDRDYLTVLPHPAVNMMINKFLENGFSFKKVDVELGFLNSPSFSSKSGIYQEIEMRPASSGFLNWLNREVHEVELSFIVEEDVVHLLVEVDRSYSGDGYTSVTYPITVQENEMEDYFRQVFPG